MLDLGINFKSMCRNNGSVGRMISITNYDPPLNCHNEESLSFEHIDENHVFAIFKDESGNELRRSRHKFIVVNL